MALITDLPTELLLKIFEHFAQYFLASEVRRRIPCNFREFEYLQHTFNTPPKFAHGEALKSLSLTCRYLNGPAMSTMFSYMQTTLSCWRLCDKEHSRPAMFADILEGKSLSAQYIETLHLGLKDDDYDYYQYRETNDRCLNDEILSPIPAVLGALPKLRTLRVEVDDTPIESWFSHGGAILPVKGMENLAQRLGATLANPSLATHLKSLHLALWCTHDFEIIAQSASSLVLENIRHLYIEIMDGTGPWGSDEYDRYNSTHPDYEKETMRSNLQEQYPNLRHQQGVFDLVAKCTGLHSLGVVGTHHLDLDLLDLLRKSNTLQVLCLNRVKVTSAHLLRLLSPTQNQSTSSFDLSRVHFSQVELKDGQWRDILTHLALLPSMRYFCASYLDYTLDGESAALRLAGSFRIWSGSAENILSVWPLDNQALNDLWRILVRRAGGIGSGKYPHEPDMTSDRPRLYN